MLPYHGDVMAIELDSDSNGAIDISKGGTNATTAEGALVALGAAPALGADDNYVTDAEKTKIGGIEAGADVTDADNVGTVAAAAIAKVTPADADTVPLTDSAAASVLKKLSWTNIKATLKTYFDGLYPLSAGKSGGQVLTGGTDAADILTLKGTSGNGTTGSGVKILTGNNGARTVLDATNAGDVSFVGFTLGASYIFSPYFRIKNIATGATVPTYSNNNDLDTGFGFGADDAASIVAGGVEAARFTESGGTISTSLTGNVNIIGEVTAGTKTFLIDHPVDPLNKTLRHVAIESPSNLVLWYGIKKLVAGKATVNLDADCASPMIAGTYEALVNRGTVSTLKVLQGTDPAAVSFENVVSTNIIGNQFTIVSSNAASTKNVVWLVIGERKDPWVMAQPFTDANGSFIPEQLKVDPAPDALTDKIEITTDPTQVGESFEPADVLGKKGYYRYPGAYGATIPQRKIIRVLAE